MKDFSIIIITNKRGQFTTSYLHLFSQRRMRNNLYSALSLGLHLLSKFQNNLLQ